MTETDACSDRMTLPQANGTGRSFGEKEDVDGVRSGGRLPRPVRCITIRKMLEVLHGVVAPDPVPGILATIVDRLRADDELAEVTAIAR
jgi:hypothetical protein